MLSALRRPWFAYAVAALLLGLITWIDTVASPELSFIVFYFLPVSLAAWGGSRSPRASMASAEAPATYSMAM